MSAESESTPGNGSPGTRDKILDVAERLIARHGTEGFQLKDVADGVGIRPPSVYAHFDGKQAISREVAFRLYHGIAERLAIDGVETGDPSGLLGRVVERTVGYFTSHPGHLRLVLRDLAHTAFANEETEPPTNEAWQRTTRTFEVIMERGIELGQFRPIRPAAALSQIVGAIVVNMCWYGWDEEGHPTAMVSTSQIVEESQQMAQRLLRADPA
jgi:AcrR family transcriptional regulator